MTENRNLTDKEKSQQRKDLLDLLKEAVLKAYKYDKSLIEVGGMERAFVFRIGVYLNKLIRKSYFKGLKLDSEYNKNLGSRKSTKSFSNGIVPDLIIHKRKSNCCNKIAIEFKGWWERKPSHHYRDIKKLEDLTSQDNDNEYKYLLGVFVELGKGKATCLYFINGSEVKDIDKVL